MNYLTRLFPRKSQPITICRAYSDRKISKRDSSEIKIVYLQKISFINDKNMATIIRQSYIDKIERYLGKETIIVLVDQRGVGKECS